MSHSTWKEYYTDATVWFSENAASLDIINLLNTNDPSACIQNLQNWTVLVALTIDSSTDELVMFTRVGLSLKKRTSKKTERIVALNCVSNSALIIRFCSATETFDKKFIVPVESPADDELKAIESITSFNELKSVKENVKKFRNLLILPPFVVASILSSNSMDLSVLANHIVVANQNILERLKDLPDFDMEDHKAAHLCVLELL